MYVCVNLHNTKTFAPRICRLATMAFLKICRLATRGFLGICRLATMGFLEICRLATMLYLLPFLHTITITGAYI